MPYPDRYKLTEIAHNKPMAEIIAELLNAHTLNDSAAILNVNPATFWRWMKRAGVKRCFVASEDCTAAQPDTAGERR